MPRVRTVKPGRIFDAVLAVLFAVTAVLALVLLFSLGGCAASPEGRYRIEARKAENADFAIRCKRAGGVVYPRGVDGRAARPQCYAR